MYKTATLTSQLCITAAAFENIKKTIVVVTSTVRGARFKRHGERCSVSHGWSSRPETSHCVNTSDGPCAL